MSNTPTYDRLTAERRLEIEHRLYEKLFEKPFTDRKIPDEPTDRQREYLISCIQDAIRRKNVMPSSTLDVTRELTAQQGDGTTIVDPKMRSEQAVEFLAKLCTSKRLPYDLTAEVKAAKEQLASGKLITNAYGREKKIQHTLIGSKYMLPLGYTHSKVRSSTGYLAFEKERTDGTRLICDFDFGTWRSTVLVSFIFIKGNLRVVIMPLRYDQTADAVPILTKDLLDKTMANVAFVVTELEGFLNS
jgi:hypothetical protein